MGRTQMLTPTLAARRPASTVAGGLALREDGGEVARLTQGVGRGGQGEGGQAHHGRGSLATAGGWGAEDEKDGGARHCPGACNVLHGRGHGGTAVGAVGVVVLGDEVGEASSGPTGLVEVVMVVVVVVVAADAAAVADADADDGLRIDSRRCWRCCTLAEPAAAGDPGTGCRSSRG